MSALHPRHLKRLAALGLGTLGLLLPREAAAQSTQAQGFSLNRFEPSERGSDWFVLESLDLRGHGRPAFGVVVDGAYRPLVLYNADGSIDTAIVNHQIFAHPGAAVTLFERLRLATSIPLAIYQEGSEARFRGQTYSPPQAPAFGDLRASVDLRLVGTYGDPITLALGTQVFFPTGSRRDFTGDETMRLQPRVLVAGDLGRLAYAARVGFSYRPHDTSFGTGELGSELSLAASLGLRVLDRKLLLGPEVFSSTTFNDPFAKVASPVEGLLGAHYNAGDVRFGAGAGVGLARGFGTPELRWLASIEWAPAPHPKDRDHDGILDDDDACPDVRGVRTLDPQTNGCPPQVRLDSDGDGVFDDEDACVTVPGVRTGNSQTNGCPADRDKDGILDRDDACPDVAGPRRDDPKTTGCPDRDNDGIVDILDACPDVPGVASTDPKTNGCPADPDRDKDGVLNADDACPDEPGKPDPDPKRNGCPKAFISGGQIKIIDQVRFATASAAIVPGRDSEEILEAVLKVLKDHPEITKVRVEGHTDNQGAAAMNKKLSEERAASVVKWLIAHGIDKARLSSAGFGLERPLDTNDTVDGRKLNRRVEFHIEDEKAAPTP